MDPLTMDSDQQPTCDSGNPYDGRLGVRISAIFVILVTSSFGALFPVIAKKVPKANVPDFIFFFAKYFGSGVIIATAFIHLLAPANEALGNSCLTGVISKYPWPEGIALMSLFSLFFVELLAMRYATFSSFSDPALDGEQAKQLHKTIEDDKPSGQTNPRRSSAPGVDHLGHVRDHRDRDEDLEQLKGGLYGTESYAAQLTSLFILEFGVIFHSVFIGLTLAVSGDEFTTLYIVLVFHQMFEGLGLGARLAQTPFPKSKSWTPWAMAIAYGLTTPIAIAIGLGVRTTYPPESATTLIVNGVFDSISAGILLYTGLIELMAHEFLFSNQLRNAKGTTLWLAFGFMVAGAGIMALLGYWA